MSSETHNLITEFKAKTRKFLRKVDKAKKGVGDFTGKTEKSSSSLRSFKRAGEVAAGMLIRDMTRGLQSAVKESISLGGSVETLKNSFQSMIGETKDAGKELNKLKKATGGTVSEVDLLTSANKALALGIPREELASLFEAAMNVGHAMGQNTTRAVEDLTVALGRQSPKILDNLGIQLSLTDAHREYADRLGKSVDALTEEEKAMAFTQVAMRKLKERSDNLEGSISKTMLSQEKFSAGMENLKTKVGKLLSPLGGIAPILEGSIPLFGTFAGTLIPNLIAEYGALGAATTTWGAVTAATTKLVSASIYGIPILGWIAAAISALIALYTAWQNNWFGIRDIVNNVLGEIRDRLSWFIKGFKQFANTIKGTLGWIGDKWKALTGAVGTELDKQKEDVRSSYEAQVKTVKEKMREQVAEVKNKYAEMKQAEVESYAARKQEKISFWNSQLDEQAMGFDKTVQKYNSHYNELVSKARSSHNERVNEVNSFYNDMIAEQKVYLEDIRAGRKEDLDNLELNFLKQKEKLEKSLEDKKITQKEFDEKMNTLEKEYRNEREQTRDEYRIKELEAEKEFKNKEEEINKERAEEIKQIEKEKKNKVTEINEERKQKIKEIRDSEAKIEKEHAEKMRQLETEKNNEIKEIKDKADSDILEADKQFHSQMQTQTEEHSAAMKNIWDDLWDGVKEWAADIVDKAKGAWQDTKDLFSKAQDKAGDIVDAAKSAWDKATSLFDRAKDKKEDAEEMEDEAEDIGDTGGGDTGDGDGVTDTGTYSREMALAGISREEYYAQHGFEGLVREPTTFTVAEKRPEYVSVTPRGRGKPSKTIRFNAPLVNVEGDASEETARLAARLIRRELSRVVEV